MNALVIDDSKAMRSILKKILNEVGFDVVQAGDGRQALEGLARVGKFDLALVDWNMPEMSGIEFIEAVRAEKAYDEMSLMMVTTETEMSQVVRALDTGANEYLMKPFTKELLLEKLAILGLVNEDSCDQSAS